MSEEITIGIVGGYGDTGIIISEELIKDPACRLRIGGRNQEKINQHVMKLGQRASGKKVDVNQEAEIAAFCKDCSIIINCTGPSWIIKDRVIRHALHAGCDYVDLGIWHDQDHLYQRSFEERGLTGLLYAGWVPGVTGLLPRYLCEEAEKSLDSIQRLNVYCGDRCGWSATATHDIMFHFIRGVEPGVYENGKWSGKYAPYAIWGAKYYHFPGNFGGLFVTPGYTVELEKLAQEKKLPRMGAYIGSAGVWGNIKLFLVRHARISDEKAVSILMNIIKNEAEKHGPGGAISCVLTGRKNGKQVKLTAGMFDANNVRVTGLCTAVATRMIIEKKIKKKGLQFLCDAVDPGVFFRRLEEYGIKIQRMQQG